MDCCNFMKNTKTMKTGTKFIRIFKLIFIFSALSLRPLIATASDQEAGWHYMGGFNVGLVGAFHTDDSKIAVHAPIGAFCAAVNKFGVYMRMSMSPTIATHNIVDNLSQMAGIDPSAMLPDGRTSLKAVYNQVCIGPVFRIRPGLYLYGGAGWYQMRAYVKNDTGDYVRIQNRCTRGLGIDAGAIYRYRHVFATAGATLDSANWFDNSPYHPFWSGNLSFGYFF